MQHGRASQRNWYPSIFWTQPKRLQQGIYTIAVRACSQQKPSISNWNYPVKANSVRTERNGLVCILFLTRISSLHLMGQSPQIKSNGSQLPRLLATDTLSNILKEQGMSVCPSICLSICVSLRHVGF